MVSGSHLSDSYSPYFKQYSDSQTQKTHIILKQEQPDHIIQALSVPLQRALCNTILYNLYKCNKLYNCNTVLLHKLLSWRTYSTLVFLSNFNSTKNLVVRAGTIVRWTTRRTRSTVIVRAETKQNNNMASSVIVLHESEKNEKNWGKYIMNRPFKNRPFNIQLVPCFLLSS